jgi:hypothetical protein
VALALNATVPLRIRPNHVVKMKSVRLAPKPLTVLA